MHYDKDWRTGTIVNGWLNCVHIYGDDMVTNRYEIKVDDSGEIANACILWDSVELESVLEALARL
jgi:hypothetical protein